MSDGTSGEGVGVAKEDVNTADTPARPGINSLENPEPGTQSHLDHEADKMAKKGINRQAHNDGDIFSNM